jgi:hypothetical protein
MHGMHDLAASHTLGMASIARPIAEEPRDFRAENDADFLKARNGDAVDALLVFHQLTGG